MLSTANSWISKILRCKPKLSSKMNRLWVISERCLSSSVFIKLFLPHFCTPHVVTLAALCLKQLLTVEKYIIIAWLKFCRRHCNEENRLPLELFLFFFFFFFALRLLLYRSGSLSSTFHTAFESGRYTLLQHFQHLLLDGFHLIYFYYSSSIYFLNQYYEHDFITRTNFMCHTWLRRKNQSSLFA